MVRGRVFVTLKRSVFDPQGKTIQEALASLGYAKVSDVRQGKFFDIALDGVEPAAAGPLLEEIARRVLANPVIESCRVEVEG
jgi:phosphoribosylformylglycinamidine synthase